MASINDLTIPLTVTSDMTRISIGRKIWTGDTAITLEIDWSDVDVINGQILLHFVWSSGQYNILVTPTGGAISFKLPAGILKPGLVCYASAVDGADIFTPLEICFSRIYDTPSGTPITEVNEYPDFLQAIADANEATADAQMVVDTANQINEAYAAAEQARDGLYANAETARDGLYSAAESARGGQYEAAELVRDGEYTSAESARDGQYSDQEIVRDGQYTSAESARDNLYTAAESARDGEYNDAEDARDGLYSDAEVARGGQYSAAEDLRDDAYDAAELARDGLYAAAEVARSKWAAYDPLKSDYAIGNKVSYLGSSYIVHTAPPVGTLPTNAAYYALIASKGDTGDAGTITVNSTNTAINGLVAGNGSKISAPIAAQVDALPIGDAGSYFTTDQLGPAMQQVGSQLAQTLSQTPLATYTHTSNPVAVISAVTYNADTPANTFTSVGHPFVNGDKVNPIMNFDAGLIYPLDKMPSGLSYLAYPGYYIVGATANTFQLSLTSGGAPIALTINANMDLTKWHIEKIVASTINITGLPAAAKYKVVMRGKTTIPDANGNILPYGFALTAEYIGISKTTYGYPVITFGGDISVDFECLVDYTRYVTIKSKGLSIKSTSASAMAVTAIDSIYKSPKFSTGTMTGVAVMSPYIANNSYIEVYRA